MTVDLQPVHAGMLIAPELLVCDVLREEMARLAGDRARQDELFARPEGHRPNTDVDRWAAEMRRAFDALLDPAGNGINVTIGYPMQPTHMPAVSVVIAGGGEDDASATMGNVLHRTGEALGDLADDSGRARSNTLIGIDWRTTVQVGSWTTAPELTSVLHAVVKMLLFGAKGRLMPAGVYDIALSDSGIQPDPNFYPLTSYVPIVSLRMTHTIGQTRRHDPVATKVTVRRGRYVS